MHFSVCVWVCGCRLIFFPILLSLTVLFSFSWDAASTVLQHFSSLCFTLFFLPALSGFFVLPLLLSTSPLISYLLSVSLAYSFSSCYVVSLCFCLFCLACLIRLSPTYFIQPCNLFSSSFINSVLFAFGYPWSDHSHSSLILLCIFMMPSFFSLVFFNHLCPSVVLTLPFPSLTCSIMCFVMSMIACHSSGHKKLAFVPLSLFAFLSLITAFSLASDWTRVSTNQICCV